MSFFFLSKLSSEQKRAAGFHCVEKRWPTSRPVLQDPTEGLAAAWRLNFAQSRYFAALSIQLLRLAPKRSNELELPKDLGCMNQMWKTREGALESLSASKVWCQMVLNGGGEGRKIQLRPSKSALVWGIGMDWCGRCGSARHLRAESTHVQCPMSHHLPTDLHASNIFTNRARTGLHNERPNTLLASIVRCTILIYQRIPCLLARASVTVAWF